jgi:hypothetical protein
MYLLKDVCLKGTSKIKGKNLNPRNLLSEHSIALQEYESYVSCSFTITLFKEKVLALPYTVAV